MLIGRAFHRDRDIPALPALGVRELCVSQTLSDTQPRYRTGIIWTRKSGSHFVSVSWLKLLKFLPSGIQALTHASHAVVSALCKLQCSDIGEMDDIGWVALPCAWQSCGIDTVLYLIQKSLAMCVERCWRVQICSSSNCSTDLPVYEYRLSGWYVGDPYFLLATYLGSYTIKYNYLHTLLNLFLLRLRNNIVQGSFTGWLVDIS